MPRELSFIKGDGVEILDDAGRPTGVCGLVEFRASTGTYVVSLWDEDRMIGTQASHMRRRLVKSPMHEDRHGFVRHYEVPKGY
jgi:hypothetical protein